MIRIGVSGARGRMGQRIITLSKEDRDLKIVFGLERKGHPDVGKVFGEVEIIDDSARIKECDCLIEFTTPLATVEHLPYLVKFEKCAVIGTTGLNEGQQKMIEEASQKIPIVFSPNMSVGVNLLFKLIRDAACVLKDYKVYIQETHHIHKKDAPSGTAKRIAQILNEEGFSIKAEDIKAERIDEVVGDHKVIFESNLDRLEFFHSAKTRDIFAQGALVAARWVVGKPPKLYSMGDVLFKG